MPSTEYNKQYYLAHKAELDARCKVNDLAHAEARKLYREQHKEEAAARDSARYQSDKVRIDARIRAYVKKREKVDHLFKMSNYMRRRLRVILKAKSWKKTSSFFEYTGCSLDKLKVHLEKQFQPGMTWDNHSPEGWHVDHIIPLASARTIEELIKLCHYTNLQPLWADTNLRKGKKLILK